ncbi:MAG TPA: DUF1223 domain-containing protein [Edaphobacter sp.]
MHLISRRPLSILIALIATIPTISFAQNTAPDSKTPVVVELFTSEGCSSCPPADALLAKMDKEQPVSNAEIIVLEEHVDYWEKGGWHDRFSSSQYTDRQNQYAPRLKFDSAYTPQMIVDGTTQFVGNDGPRALNAVVAAAGTPKVALTLSNPVVDGHRVACSVTSPASATALPKADLYAVLIDPTATTQVQGGENKGRQLEHVGVVRSMKRIGKLQDLGKGPLAFNLNAPSDMQPGNLRVVVFAQSSDLGPIKGAASVSTKQ